MNSASSRRHTTSQRTIEERDMKTVVITGSTRGIGFGLADSFLAQGCKVMLSGREQASLSAAVQSLRLKHGDGKVHGVICNVQDPQQIRELWKASIDRFERVDIWINNAGISGPYIEIKEIAQEEVKAVLTTNMLGVIYGSQIAVNGMFEQGFGAIYNMEGMGSDGRMHARLVIYGMTKYGTAYFTKGLVEETKGGPVIIGSLRPGMVATEFVEKQYVDRPEEWERAKRIFNILADRVETVTPWLAEKILENERHGAVISWSSRWKLLSRFLTAPFRKRDIFDSP
jgi:short-subunit dehydrogenase